MLAISPYAWALRTDHISTHQLRVPGRLRAPGQTLSIFQQSRIKRLLIASRERYVPRILVFILSYMI